MGKIYIVVKEQVYDFESSPISVERHNNKEEAIDALEEDYKDYLDAYYGCGFVSEWNDNPESAEVEGVDFGKEIVSCEAYRDGEWSKDHYVGKVVEFEV